MEVEAKMNGDELAVEVKDFEKYKKQEVQELAEEIIRIEMLMTGALVRMNHHRPEGSDEWGRKWRVSIDHLLKARDYWQQRIMTDQMVARVINEIRMQAIAQTVPADALPVDPEPPPAEIAEAPVAP